MDDWERRRQAAQAIVAEVEQHQEQEINSVMTAGFVAAALMNARDLNGEPMGIAVEPVMVDGLATPILRFTVPGLFKSEYFLSITQGKELE